MGTSNKYLLLCTALFFMGITWAQDSIPVAEIYSKARTQAFEHKNYDNAIALMSKVTQRAPENVDYSIFLGRLYTWNKQTEKARQVLQTVFENYKDYEDAALAYASLEFWNDKPEKGLAVVDAGLEHHPKSESLLVLKAKILTALKRHQEAGKTLGFALQHHPKSTQIRGLLQNTRGNTANNEVGVSYNFVTFKERFDQPWHIASLHYGRQTGIGPLFGRLNYGNRFANGAAQFELDFYPRISSTFYAYINAGLSNDLGVFPEYRAGLSLYASLPASFELDAGFRWLQFANETWIYTFGLGKYVRNYWFNFRTYLNAAEGDVADSYSFTTRYYFGGVDDYFNIQIGTGFSPDNTNSNVLINTGTRLNSTNFLAGFRKLFGKSHVVFVELEYSRVEFSSDSFDDQYSFKLGYIKRF